MSPPGGRLLTLKNPAILLLSAYSYTTSMHCRAPLRSAQRNVSNRDLLVRHVPILSTLFAKKWRLVEKSSARKIESAPKSCSSASRIANLGVLVVSSQSNNMFFAESFVLLSLVIFEKIQTDNDIDV